VNFLNITSKAHQIESLLHSFCLYSTVEFPKRNIYTSHTTIDNIFIDKKKLNTKVYPIINGISDHDAQLAILLNLSCPSKTPPVYSRVINNLSLNNFVELLSYESWETIFSNDDVDTIFNFFLDTYLKIFQSCFLVKRKLISFNSKPCITHGIKISCANKKKLYETTKHRNDPSLRLYYKKYCKILTSTIQASKGNTIIN
jgi:ribosomal protein L33